jgi:hypothetical protein
MYNDFDKIDKLAKDALRDYEMDFNPEDWKKMEARLDKKEHKIPRIFLMKTIEASLILLVLFTAFNVFYYQNELRASNDIKLNRQDNNTALAQVFFTSDEAESSKKIDNTNVKNEKKNIILNSNTSKKENYKSDKTVLAEALKETYKTNKASSDKFSSSSSKNSNFKSITKNKDRGNTNEVSKSLGTNFDKNISVVYQNDNGVTENNNNFISNSDRSDKITLNSDLKLISIETIKEIRNQNKKDGNGDPVEEGKGYTLKNDFKFPKLYHRQISAAAFAGAEMNFANKIGNENVGFSFGVFFEYEISNRFAFRTAFITSRKNFSKTYNTILDRTAEEGVIYYSKIDQNTGVSVFSVPVLFNGIIIRNEKWKISATAGPSLSLLTHRFVSGEKRTDVMQSSGNVTAITDLNPNDFEKGLLQGAKAENNIFVAAMLGVEIERQLGNRVSIFVQPLYSVGLTKIGDEKDRLQNLSINIGLKGIIK